MYGRIVGHRRVHCRWKASHNHPRGLFIVEVEHGKFGYLGMVCCYFECLARYHMQPLPSLNLTWNSKSGPCRLLCFRKRDHMGNWTSCLALTDFAYPLFFSVKMPGRHSQSSLSPREALELSGQSTPSRI